MTYSTQVLLVLNELKKSFKIDKYISVLRSFNVLFIDFSMSYGTDVWSNAY